MNDDAELLHRYARAGDAQAFTALVQRHLPMVYRAAWRQLGGDVHAAEDTVQTVFMLLARKARGLGGHANLAGWLHVATQHVVRDQRRGAARRAARELEAAHMNATFDVEQSADWNRLRPVLDEALGELREADREAILLRYFQGLSLAAVGTALDLSEDAARMRVNRALEKLRERLARRGVTSTAVALGVALAAEPAMAAPWTGLAASVSTTALAHGAAAGTGAVALGWTLHLMNSAKLAATGVVAMATVGWATWEHGQLERAIAPVAVPVPATPLAAQPAKPLPVPAVSAAPAARPNPDVARAAEAQARGDALMARHPEVRTAFLDYARARIATENAAYFAERRLTPEQRTAFVDITLEGGTSFPVIPGDTVLQLPKRMAGAERDQLLEQALGPEEWEAFQAYRKGLVGDSVVKEVTRLSRDSGETMTTEQARALREMVVAIRAGGIQQNSAEFWDAVIPQARTRLPAAQVEALAMLRARYEFDVANGDFIRAEVEGLLARMQANGGKE